MTTEEYAKQKGYTKYFQRGGKWYANIEGSWITQPDKASARIAAGLDVVPPTTTTIPTGAAAVGKQVRINGTLYPSQEWYNVNVLGKKETPTTTVTPTPTLTPTSTTKFTYTSTDPYTRKLQGLEQSKTLADLASVFGFNIPSGYMPTDERGLVNIIKEQAQGGGFESATRPSFLNKVMGMYGTFKTKEELSVEDLSDKDVLPVIPTTVASDAEKAISGASGLGTLFQSMTDQLAKASEQREKLTEQQQTWLQKLTSRETKSQAGLLAEQQEKLGVSKMFEQIQGITNMTLPLQQQIADLTTQETTEIDRVGTMGMSEGWRNRKESEVHNKYNRMKAPIATQLNAYAAQASALQGNLSLANSFISQAVSAATYDQELEYNQMRDFMSINQGFLDSLKSDERFLFNTALDLRKEALDTAKSEKNNVMNLMLQYPSAGISIEDTMESAAQKASGWAGVQPTDQKTGWDTGTPTSYKEWVLAERPGTYEEWLKKEAPTTDADRIAKIGSFVEEGRGEDRLIAAETYIEAQKGWIASGGTISDFRAAFPPESLMGDWELKRLPSSIYKSPKTYDIEDLLFGAL